MDTTQIITIVAAGLAGGNAAAAMFPDKSLGFVLNSFSGIGGGMFGAGVLAIVLRAGEGASAVIQHAAGSGTGGAAFMILAGFLRYRRRP